jgi:hypothetical protein
VLSSSSSRQKRFLVQPNSLLRVSSEKGIVWQHLVATVSEQGFGLYCTHRESKLISLKSLHFSARIGSLEFKASAKIHYFKCLPQMSPPAYFVGCQWNVSETELNAWATILEELHQKGDLRLDTRDLDKGRGEAIARP